MRDFIITYVRENMHAWKQQPKVFYGDGWQDCVILVFGEPKCAAFAHMDTTGFTVRYQDQLIPVGSPEVQGGEKIIGRDTLGEIECEVQLNKEGQLRYKFGRAIQSGTNLVYAANFEEGKDTIRSPYFDNRVGVYNLLKQAESIENGALVFSCWEEHGGGTVPYLVRFLYEEYNIQIMLVSDVTWVTDGVHAGKGVVISYRDQNIPRKSFVDTIETVAIKHSLDFQVEVEAYGSSDGREIQLSPYPIDWCFVGPPVANAHSNKEIINKKDLNSMLTLYRILLSEL